MFKWVLNTSLNKKQIFSTYEFLEFNFPNVKQIGKARIPSKQTRSMRERKHTSMSSTQARKHESRLSKGARKHAKHVSTQARRPQE